MVPKVLFKKITLETNVDVVNLAYNNEDKNFDYRGATLKMFPDLKNKNMEQVIEKALLEKKLSIVSSIFHYQFLWDKYNNDFMLALSKVLNIPWPEDCKDIYGFIGIVPICPRDIEGRNFTFPYWLDDETLLDATAHECCHFLYFEKWKQLFPDFDKETFNPPHLIWKLSEMVIDFILNRKEIQKVLPHTFHSYYYFYENDLEEMNRIRKIYEDNVIEEAMKLSVKYLLEQEEKRLCK